MNIYMSNGKKIKLKYYNDSKKRKMFAEKIMKKYPNDFILNNNVKNIARLDMLGLYLSYERKSNNTEINSIDKIKSRKRTELPSSHLIDKYY